MGDVRLQQVAEPVSNFGNGELRELLQDMRDTMAHLSGAGLAAPQIGVGLRVVIFGVRSNPRYPGIEEVPDTVLINPEIQPLSAELEEGWEGCLSVPGMRGWVPRWRRLKYKGFDEKGQPFEREVEGFHARVVQHEVDHLNGKIFVDRADPSTFTTWTEFERYHKARFVEEVQQLVARVGS